jgi:hypothetical protein
VEIIRKEMGQGQQKEDQKEIFKGWNSIEGGRFRQAMGS